MVNASYMYSSYSHVIMYQCTHTHTHTHTHALTHTHTHACTYLPVHPCRRCTSVLLPIPTVPSPARSLTITRVFQGGVELNWLPPREPNGKVHYVIYYTPEGGMERSIDTNLTHHNLTGLHCGTTNSIRVMAVNSAGRAPATPTSSTSTPTCSTATPTTSSTQGGNNSGWQCVRQAEKYTMNIKLLKTMTETITHTFKGW